MAKTVLFFTQRSCAPCRQIEPNVIALCEKYGASLQYVKVDTEGGKETAKNAGEFTTPVVIVLDENMIELTRLRNATPILDGLPKFLGANQNNPLPMCS